MSTLELLHQLIDQANAESGGEFPSVDVDPDGEDTLVQIGGRYGIVLRFDSDGKYVDNE